MTKFLEKIKQFCQPNTNIIWLDMASDFCVYNEHRTEACCVFHCEIAGKFHNVGIWVELDTDCVELDDFTLTDNARIVNTEIAEILDEKDKTLPDISFDVELLKQLLFYRLDCDEFYNEYSKCTKQALKEKAKYDFDYDYDFDYYGVC